VVSLIKKFTSAAAHRARNRPVDRSGHILARSLTQPQPFCGTACAPLRRKLSFSLEPGTWDRSAARGADAAARSDSDPRLGSATRICDSDLRLGSATGSVTRICGSGLRLGCGGRWDAGPPCRASDSCRRVGRDPPAEFRGTPLSSRMTRSRECIPRCGDSGNVAGPKRLSGGCAVQSWHRLLGRRGRRPLLVAGWMADSVST
jgi:hypothetical protein